MTRALHTIRRSEEGQALVMAAVSLLILAMLTLATVNLTYAVGEKVRLQNSADAAAYTTAGIQARALNFFAISNRTMVVQYVAFMNLMAIVSFLTFYYAIASLIAKLLSVVPYLGAIVRVIVQILRVIMIILDVAVELWGYITDALNLALMATQFAVQTNMLAKMFVEPATQVARYNPAYRVTPLVSLVAGTSAALNWTNTVSASLNPFGTARTNEEKYGRAVMNEIANSGRSDFTAKGYGLRKPSWLDKCSGSFFICKDGRTEWGMRRVSGGLFSNITGITDEVYSRDSLRIGFRFLISLELEGRAYVTGDRHLGSHGGTIELKTNLPRLVASAIKRLINPAIQAWNDACAEAHSPFPNHFHFGQVPYARFRPTADAQLWFRQPPTIVSVTAPTADIVRRGKPFMSGFGARLGLSSANSTLMRPSWDTGPFRAGSRGRNNSFRAAKRGYSHYTEFALNNMTRRGLPAVLLGDGFNAMSAAIAYYHRPGDWREPPNTFNPFWGAKLLPVIDYPGIANTPVLSSLVTGRLFLH